MRCAASGSTAHSVSCLCKQRPTELQRQFDAGVVTEAAAVGDEVGALQHVAVVQRAPGVAHAVRAGEQAYAALMQQPQRRAGITGRRRGSGRCFGSKGCGGEIRRGRA